MKSKYRKGDYKYLSEKRRRELIKTFLMFGLSALVFFLGLLSTKTKSNYLTIVAVLGCLPAAKSAVSSIMYLRIKECDSDFAAIMEERFPSLGSFHLYFTSYHKNFATSHIFVKALTIIAYTENKELDTTAFEEHLQTVLSRDNIKGCHVKIFKDREKYLQRMEQLANLENQREMDERIKSTLFAVSL